ncbi:MAG: efflux RND transporter periplasmic adaptor subunit [Spirochaetes bacterium]|nr:efflux RND transporter periplasmic adaptor subunit [Spirochaetota bacterium]
MDSEKTAETNEKKKWKNKIILALLLCFVFLGIASIAVYFVWQSTNYLVTENARVTTTLFYIMPSAPGTLERFTVREGSFVRKNEVIGWIENSESFRSPADGVVVRTFAEQNQMVSPLEPVAVIADINNLHIQANVEETYIARLQIGQPVAVTIDALGRRQFIGYLSEIGRITDAALTGDIMSFTTTGRFTKVTQLLPVKIILKDDIDLSSFIGLNAKIKARLQAQRNITQPPDIDNKEAIPAGAARITVRGTVKSMESRNVFTTLGNIVRLVYVEAGDRVTEGQVLGILEDTDDSLLTVAHQHAESALRNARTELKTIEFSHENNKAFYAAGSISRFDFRQSEDALAHAQNRYRDAQVLFNAALHALGRQLIKAPISGAVTAVFAREGVPGPGLLFVVEDTDNLKIITRFREYDIGRIKTGMDVLITSDATGDAVYTGRISRINPAAIKNEFGETVAASVVEFEAEVAVTSANTDLRIGTNTRLTVILD